MHSMGKKTYRIHSKEYLTEDIVSMWIDAAEIAQRSIAGQFVSVYCDSRSELLPRPISICDADATEGRIRLVFRVVGKGTAEFAKKEEGCGIDIVGPLGNGYDTSYAADEKIIDKKIIIIGGGIGIPPMLKLSKTIAGTKNIVLGYRDKLFMKDDFEGYGSIYIATDNGSAGTKGTVIDAIYENNIKGDIIYACGPLPMLRAVKEYAVKMNIPAWISLEERMACGIGACLACVCKSTDIDSHSMVKNKRICKDGPVFDAREVDFS